MQNGKAILEKDCITMILLKYFVKSMLYMERKQHSWHLGQKGQNGKDCEIISSHFNTWKEIFLNGIIQEK